MDVEEGRIAETVRERERDTSSVLVIVAGPGSPGVGPGVQPERSFDRGRKIDSLYSFSPGDLFEILIRSGRAPAESYS